MIYHNTQHALIMFYLRCYLSLFRASFILCQSTYYCDCSTAYWRQPVAIDRLRVALDKGWRDGKDEV